MGGLFAPSWGSTEEAKKRCARADKGAAGVAKFFIRKVEHKWKLNLFKALVQGALTSAEETRCYSESDLKRLGSKQRTLARRILGERGGHGKIKGEKAKGVSNEMVKRRAKLHTIESVLRQRRRMMLTTFVAIKQHLPLAALLGDTVKGNCLDNIGWPNEQAPPLTQLLAQELQHFLPTFTGFVNGWTSQLLGDTNRFKRVLTFEMTQMQSLTEDVEPVPDGMVFVIYEWKSYKCRECGASLQTPRGVKMHAMIAHGKRRPERKYVTKLAGHSYQCQFCKNTYARFDLAKKHLIDSCTVYRRYLDKEAAPTRTVTR